MSNENQETIEDIVAEMRSYAKRCREENFCVPPAIERHYHEDDVEDLADRIEAAWKREREVGAEAAQICGEIGEIVGREATCSKSSQVGNADIVREVAQEMLNTSMQAVTAERINGWATRLAEACEQPVTDCNRLNNAAAMREAYEFAEEFLRDYGTDWKLHNKLCDMLKSALAAPARNCDIYDAESCRMAYHLHGNGLITMQAFADWLFAPVEEGATNEQK